MASKPTHNLNGKVAVITGSSAGIGAAIALHFVQLGASVTINGRNRDKLEASKQQYKQLKDKVLAISGDVCDENVRIQLINETVNHFGRLDILVNNAGSYDAQTLSSDFKVERLDKMLDVHVRVPFHLTKLAIPHLVKTKGNVINISSVDSTIVHADIATEYAIAKAGLDRLTQVTAREMGPKTVRANCINPGAIQTELLASLESVFKEACNMPSDEGLDKIHALQRMGKVEEVAAMAGFLASDSASFVTGTLIPVDGGLLVL